LFDRNFSRYPRGTKEQNEGQRGAEETAEHVGGSYLLLEQGGGNQRQ